MLNYQGRKTALIYPNELCKWEDVWQFTKLHSGSTGSKTWKHVNYLAYF